MRATLGSVVVLLVGWWSQLALAQPSGAHPRIWLTDEVQERWSGSVDESGSAVARARDKCDRVQAEPGEWVSGQYQGFAWVEALSACLVAWKSTGDDGYRDTALIYLRGLLDDQMMLGDGLGPGYADGLGIVAQDTGYSMRTHGVWAALGYDWLHDALTEDERDRAHERFVQWLEFHHLPDTYQRAQPGANYHAGHVLAVTLLAIGHADEMNAREADSGSELWSYAVDEMFGLLAASVLAREPLAGGDWLEGWQYAPLSVASYALAGRALVEQRVLVPWLEDWNIEVLHRYVHGLSPDDRMFVGGDTGDETPLLDINALPLWAVIASESSAHAAAAARAELERLDVDGAHDFQLFFEALAEASQVPATPFDRAREPTAWLASGAGNFYGRTSFSADATWLVSQCKGTVVDHQHPNAGNLVLSRGADALLVDPGPYGSLSTLTGNAPTMSQPHFNENYRPSQAAWGERSGGLLDEEDATRFSLTRATTSNVLATRCDWDGQLRFQDNPSETVSDATRDVVLLPGVEGASVVIVDRVLTTAAWMTDASPLLLRFRSLGAFEEDGDSARANVGASRLTVRRLVGDATTDARAITVGDCFSGDRGKCETGRFAGSEWRANVAGPQPFAVHVLDADASEAADSIATATADGTLEQIVIERESRRFVVLVTRDASEATAYESEAAASTHVILDPPAGERVVVTASKGAAGCEIELAAGTGDDGFASRPLVFTLDEDCVAAEETSQAPVVTPGDDGGVAGSSGSGGSGGDGGSAGNAGAGGTSGSGGASGSGATGDDAGMTGDDAGTAASNADSDCGCSALGAKRSPHVFWMGGLVTLWIAGRLLRRSRR
jgi:uncharacterized membrane protein YgcG